MNLSEFRSLLSENPFCGLALTLPDGELVPPHYHITEVARAQKSFIDCGGKRHQQSACVLQVWLADDHDHRLEAGKLARVMKMAEDLFADCDAAELPVLFEHEAPVLTALTVEKSEVANSHIVLHLALQHADCLAKELCLPKRDFSLPAIPKIS